MSSISPATTTVLYVSCYYAVGYIRRENFISALRRFACVSLVLAVNQSTGFVRYFQTFAALLRARKSAPEVVILGFRGHEVYPLVKLLFPKSFIIFDEMMSPSLSLVKEPGKSVSIRMAGMLLSLVERRILDSVDLVVTDTETHAQVISRYFRLDRSKVLDVPIARVHLDQPSPADEDEHSRQERGVNTVLYYGSFLPLHGLPIVLDALPKIKTRSPVKFIFIGPNADKLISDWSPNIPDNVTVETISFIPYASLISDYIKPATLVLGGPFQSTPQGLSVITGKTVDMMAMGKAVIVGLNDETKWLIDSDVCLGVELCNADALAECISGALENSARVRQIERSAREFIDTTYQSRFNERFAKMLKRAEV